MQTVSHHIPEYNNPPVPLFPHASSIADERPVYDAEYNAKPQVRRMETNHRTVIVDAIVDDLPHEVSFQALALYTYLERHVNPEGKYWASYNRIAEDCNVSRRYVIDLIADLEKAGYVQVSRTKDASGNNRPNEFFLPQHITRIPSEQPSAYPAPPSEQGGERPSAQFAPIVVTSSQEVVTSSSRPTKPKRDPIANPSGPAQEIVSAWCRATGATQPVNFGKAMGNAAQLSKAGITAADIPDILAWLDRDKFWSGKGHDLGVVLNQADKWRSSKKRGTNRNEELVF